VTVAYERVAALAARGMSLDEIKAARPSLDYDGRYGRETGATEAFIDAVYQAVERP